MAPFPSPRATKKRKDPHTEPPTGFVEKLRITLNARLVSARGEGKLLTGTLSPALEDRCLAKRNRIRTPLLMHLSLLRSTESEWLPLSDLALRRVGQTTLRAASSEPGRRAINSIPHRSDDKGFPNKGHTAGELRVLGYRRLHSHTDVTTLKTWYDGPSATFNLGLNEWNRV